MPHPADELRSGVLEVLPDGFGFLRDEASSFLPGSEDIYVSPSQIRKFDLRDGDRVTGRVRPPKESERYFAMIRLEQVNGSPPGARRLFSRLTAQRPDTAVRLDSKALGLRLLECFAPLAYGSRGLLVGPARTGASHLMRQLAASVRSDATVLLVLVDTRPEEVTDARQLGLEVLSSTFDEPIARHVQVAELAAERARRLAESGLDVLLLIDGLDRFDRASDDPQRVRRLFGAGRCLAEGGSLTLVATTRPDSRCAIALSSANTLLWRLDDGLARTRSFPALDLSACWSDAAVTQDPRLMAMRQALTGDAPQDLTWALGALEQLDKVASAGN